MENNDFEKNMSLKGVLGGFIRSYIRRDTNVEFHDWFADRMRQELPGMTLEACAQLTGNIVKAVAGYDQTLNDLNRAIKANQSEKNWLSERFAEACDGKPISDVEDSLKDMRHQWISSNKQIMGEADMSTYEEMSVESIPADLIKLFTSVTLCAAASALNRNIYGERSEGSDTLIEVFKKGSNTVLGELKIIVAGAARVVAEKGVTDILPFDTPIEIIGALAGAAVESGKALFDAANGDITPAEAVVKIGRAGIAAGCRIGTSLLKGQIKKITGVGLPLAGFISGLANGLKSSRLAEHVSVVKEAAAAAWGGIKQLAAKKRKVYG